MSSASAKLIKRVTENKAKSILRPKKADVEQAVVKSSGVVQINGTNYAADTAGHRRGKVIPATNVKTKGNAHYVAEFGAENNNTQTNAQLRKTIRDLVNQAIDNIPATTTTTGSTLPSMTVTPADNIEDSGTAGDDFTYNTQTYTLTNTGTASLDWTIEHPQYWVDLSAASGTLAAGASTTVDVSVNSGASYLTGGGYVDVIVFYADSYAVATRFVTLEITAVEPLDLYVYPTGAVNIQMISGGSGTISYEVTLGNIGSSDLNWQAVVQNDYVSISPSSGFLAVDDYTYPTVTVDSALYSGGVSSYTDLINFYIEAA